MYPDKSQDVKPPESHHPEPVHIALLMISLLSLTQTRNAPLDLACSNVKREDQLPAKTTRPDFNTGRLC